MWGEGAWRSTARSLAALSLLALAAAGPASASPASAPRYPLLTGRVVDAADLLDLAAEAALTRASKVVEDGMGAQFVVVTVPSLQGRTVEAFSLGLARHWAIGRKGVDDGLVLLVAPNDRKVRIEVGYGLEKTIRNEEAKVIIDQAIRPSFRAGDMQAGILRGSAALLRELAHGRVQ